MRAISTHKLLLLGILAIANIGLLVWLGVRRTQSHPAAELGLPAVELLDDTGKRVWLNKLIGKPLVLHFVDPQVTQQIEAVSNLLNAFEKSDVQFVLITQRSQEVRRVLPALSEKVIVVQNNYAELKKTFKVPDCCEQRLVFDSDGKFEYRDYYYGANLTPRINSLVRKTLPDASTAILELLGARKTGLFASLREQTRRSTSGKGVVVLFTSVSSSCPSGELAAVIGRSLTRQDNDHLLLLPRDYSETDIENFRTNFKISFQVEKFDPELEENWGALVNMYGEPSINGAVIFINRGELSVLNDLVEIEQRLAQF